MAGGTVADRLLRPAIVVPAALLGFGLAVALAGAAAAPFSSVLRIATGVAGILTFGLAALDLLEEPKLRPALRSRVWQPLAAAAGIWAMAALALSVALTADSANVPLPDVSLPMWGEYLDSVSTGRLLVLEFGCATVCAVLAGLEHNFGRQHSTLPLLALSVLGLAGLPLGGHLSQQSIGAMVILAHVLCAAIWCGLLGAMAVTLRRRGEWSRMLPRFSVAAFFSVWVLLATGVLGALLQPTGRLRREGSNPAAILTALVETGYGRILLAKTVLLALLIAAGWWSRRNWVPAARGHRLDADVSLRRACGEIAVMAVVLGLAAALATTA
ncbi:CopD family protein [Tomitella biformata]|uniref:CopD family protein n=1 Tax=Tomitella biformata TaxID=630403 RepID=UPI000464477C|nr:CopD family protein [Tomitella biformata]